MSFWRRLFRLKSDVHAYYSPTPVSDPYESKTPRSEPYRSPTEVADPGRRSSERAVSQTPPES